MLTNDLICIINNLIIIFNNPIIDENCREQQ